MLPPTLDPVAARRWVRLAGRWTDRQAPSSPWLHEEVARRMMERLDILTLQPTRWGHWNPVQGGLEAHRRLMQCYPSSDSFMLFDGSGSPQAAINKIVKKMGQPAPAAKAGLGWAQQIGHQLRSWMPARGAAPTRSLGVSVDEPAQAQMPQGTLQLLWANMGLHLEADPEATLRRWSDVLQTDGILMFSALGPDSLRELRQVYAGLGWPAPMHDYTDMHDWGDMLLAQGFADPVLDVERITLTFQSPARVLDELRGLGRNLHRQRSSGLRGRAWRAQLLSALDAGLRRPEPGLDAGRSPLALTFEIVYGHAIKAPKKLALQGELTLSLDDMRSQLKRNRPRD